MKENETWMNFRNGFARRFGWMNGEQAMGRGELEVFSGLIWFFVIRNWFSEQIQFGFPFYFSWLSLIFNIFSLFLSFSLIPIVSFRSIIIILSTKFRSITQQFDDWGKKEVGGGRWAATSFKCHSELSTAIWYFKRDIIQSRKPTNWQRCALCQQMHANIYGGAPFVMRTDERIESWRFYVHVLWFLQWVCNLRQIHGNCQLTEQRNFFQKICFCFVCCCWCSVLFGKTKKNSNKMRVERAKRTKNLWNSLMKSCRSTSTQ